MLENNMIERKVEHKYLGVIVDAKTELQSHARDANFEATKGIGMTRNLSSYVSMDILDQIDRAETAHARAKIRNFESS